MNAAAAWQRLDDRLVLLDTQRGRYYELNATASRMFELIAEDTSVDQIVTTICEEFEVDEPTARADLQRVIDELREQRFIED